MRAFALDWARQALTANQDNTPVAQGILAFVLSALTTDSSAKLRSSAAKCLLDAASSHPGLLKAQAARLAASASLGLADVSQDVTKECERLLSCIAPYLAFASHEPHPLQRNSAEAMPMVRHGALLEGAEPEEMDLLKHRRLVHWEAPSMELGSEAMQQLLTLLFEGLDAQLAPAGPPAACTAAAVMLADGC